MPLASNISTVLLVAGLCAALLGVVVATAVFLGAAAAVEMYFNLLPDE